ncbi:MAG: hypothetical protein R2734_07585 [Nocardioides sp.]
MRNPWVTRIHLNGGVEPSDIRLIDLSLSGLFRRLDAWPLAVVEMWLRVKDRDESGMKTTLEVSVPGLPRLVASCREESLAPALNRISDVLVRRLNEAAAQRF